MAHNIVDRLTETFRRFPGIGPRQARRFVYHLLREGQNQIDRLTAELHELGKAVAQCQQCFRFYSAPVRPESGGPAKTCDLCQDLERDNSLLMVVEKDADLEAVRQSDTYNGHFFVLGGLIPILEKEPQLKVRLRELTAAVTKRMADNSPRKIKEMIIALAVNPEGDHTIEFLKQTLKQFTDEGLHLTVLGRGLSTGTELEYSDTDTLKNALANRS
ncbi:MAG: toprim domain-containing protein [Patescibacteria group bacterium]